MNRLRVQSNRDNTVGRISANDDDDRRDAKSGSNAIPAQLKRKPEHAARGEEPHESHDCQIAIGTDTSGNGPLKRLRHYPPNGMMPGRGRPACILNEDPEYDGNKKDDRNPYFPHPHVVAFASRNEQDLVNYDQARKQHRVDAPRAVIIAAVPIGKPG